MFCGLRCSPLRFFPLYGNKKYSKLMSPCIGKYNSAGLFVPYHTMSPFKRALFYPKPIHILHSLNSSTTYFYTRLNDHCFCTVLHIMLSAFLSFIYLFFEAMQNFYRNILFITFIIFNSFTYTIWIHPPMLIVPTANVFFFFTH